jgi:hypothetical protein
LKYLLISLLFFFFSSQQKKTLKGVYKLEFKDTSLMQNRTIVFNDSVYSMEITKNLNSKGIIKYGKNLTFLKEGNFYPNIILSFSTKEIEKDTIDFQVHKKNSKTMNYLDVSVNTGKLIKIRN